MVAHLEIFDQASLSRPKDNLFHSEGICNLGSSQFTEQGTPVFVRGFPVLKMITNAAFKASSQEITTYGAIANVSYLATSMILHTLIIL